MNFPVRTFVAHCFSFFLWFLSDLLIFELSIPPERISIYYASFSRPKFCLLPFGGWSNVIEENGSVLSFKNFASSTFIFLIFVPYFCELVAEIDFFTFFIRPSHIKISLISFLYFSFHFLVNVHVLLSYFFHWVFLYAVVWFFSFCFLYL